MSKWGLIVVGAIYIGVALDFAWQKNYGMALIFFAYALANAGFLMAVR